MQVIRIESRKAVTSGAVRAGRRRGVRKVGMTRLSKRMDPPGPRRRALARWNHPGSALLDVRRLRPGGTVSRGRPEW
ncbi:hypothetical protein mvi_59180 [Methylobacterium indicum]|uniref:Uncharacterized protein n=1 Tax=Methylobacterium indicum TaxID=1775910 RepID=A0A8H8X072_9HYPH|nr:hypothetical protein mvi_59180 [Methylobacterium indicum]